MKTFKYYLIAALLVLAAICVVVSIAYAKNPCKRGFEPWWHGTGNGKVICQCFKKDKPPKNPVWRRGCPVDEQGGSSTPVVTVGPGNETPGPNDETYKGGSDSSFAKITRTKPKTYQITEGGEITIWWIGDLESVLICNHDKDCYPPYEPPDDGKAVNKREMRGTLFLGRSLEPGTYFLYGLDASQRTGNETNIRLQVMK